MRALRVERNPLRARALLIAYLDHHPNGKLSEEALVMLIEAAAGNGDSDAPALAARYLKLYPRGPFRGMVERMLAATSKGP
jgi:outer membrane protein assembly factor BamD (BamD/ComL family)